MYQKYKDKNSNKCSFSQQLSLSLSLSLSPPYALYTSECVFQMRNTHPLFILFIPLDFFPNKSTPTNLLGLLHLGRHKTILYYIHEGSIDPTYNGYFTSWLYDDQIQY